MADFHAHYESMKAEDIGLVAGSVDPADKIRETMEKLGTFRIPFAVDLDAREISRRYGVYFEEGKEYLHAAGFLLLPGGKILAAAYSSGPVGRLAARDVINLVRFVKSEQRKSFHLIGGLLEVR